jgi:CHASE3 domain sensor protein
MNRNTRTVATIGFGLTLALLIVSAGLSYYNTRQLVEADRMLDHTHRVISLLEAILSTLKDAETGQRASSSRRKMPTFSLTTRRCCGCMTSLTG